MDESKTNESPEDRTTVTRFPEVKGKIVESIEVYVTGDHYSTNINFTDNTALILHLEASIAMLSYYGDWKTGECNIIKEWEPVKSIPLNPELHKKPQNPSPPPDTDKITKPN
jgi:hypothetical protein